MPLALLHLKAVQVTASMTSVVASAVTGLEVAGTVGGIVGALVAVVTLAVAIISNNAKKRRDYADEIRAAEKRGYDSRDDDFDRLQSDMEFFRGQYALLLQNRAGAQAVELPPIRPPRRHPRAGAAPHREDDSERPFG